MSALADGTLLLRLMEILISTGVAVQALETLTARRLFAAGGLYDWAVISTNNKWMIHGWRGSILSCLFEYHAFLLLMCIQLAAAIFAISGAFPRFAPVFAGTMLVIHMLFLLRNQYGLDGSDQMMLLVLSGLFLYRLHPTETMLTIVFLFLCAQLILSYLTAGIAKAISPTWRKGEAVKGVLSTTSYGSKSLSLVLTTRRGPSLLLCWMVIFYECAGPLLLWVHPYAATAFVAAGILFHFSIALFMGLNIFFWSFVATYPAIYYCASRWSIFAGG